MLRIDLLFLVLFINATFILGKQTNYLYLLIFFSYNNKSLNYLHIPVIFDSLSLVS